jgi:hypothetical protein
LDCGLEPHHSRTKFAEFDPNLVLTQLSDSSSSATVIQDAILDFGSGLRKGTRSSFIKRPTKRHTPKPPPDSLPVGPPVAGIFPSNHSPSFHPNAPPEIAIKQYKGILRSVLHDLYEKKTLITSFAQSFKEDMVPSIIPYVHEGIKECIQQDTDALGTRVARVCKSMTEKQYAAMVEGKTQVVASSVVLKETCEVVKEVSRSINDNNLKMIEYSNKIQKGVMDSLITKEDKCAKQIKNVMVDVRKHIESFTEKFMQDVTDHTDTLVGSYEETNFAGKKDLLQDVFNHLEEFKEAIIKSVRGCSLGGFDQAKFTEAYQGFFTKQMKQTEELICLSHTGTWQKEMTGEDGVLQKFTGLI